MSLKNATKTETANRVELEVEVDAAAFEAAVERAYKKNIKKWWFRASAKAKLPVIWWKKCTAPVCSMRTR